MTAEAVKKQVTIYLAGDSTVQTYNESSAPQAGWGQYIAEYFSEDVRFVNKAIGGRSSKSFVAEGRLAAIGEEIQPDDYLFIQMGHNDATVSKPERYTEPFTEYKHYLGMYITGARERQAIPLLITPVGRLHYEEGRFLNDFEDYCTAMKQLAEEEQVPVLDLMTLSLKYFTDLGYEKAKELFMISHNGTDCTHFNEKGAQAVARLVSQAIKHMKMELSDYVTLTPYS
ncbi:rhamnogalacturonan acetylesterase [Paenibacillus sp. OAS669]|uniref:rhamnogalacturonan acetylesterase n=1 Tax=Paenibacillus sp. OAS669 TaxID=2663821 RepID=UPI00178B2CCD|nr:rhamnogalacturonan acetylesterase [Paenibacillus sp. OAS669]MBE1443121.1 lysophospholipase L1-like esterase [Paenibacillus sp. OAS669]